MEFLIGITIKATFILLFSGALLWVLKNATATLRHWVISLTMIGLLILPVLVCMLPDMSVTIPYLPAEKQAIERIAPKMMETPESVTNVDLELPQKRPFELKGKVENYQVNIEKTTDNQLDTINENHVAVKATKTISSEQLLLFVWLIGCLFFLLKLLIGRLLIRKITINSESFLLKEDLKNYVATLTNKQVDFRISKAIKTPMTWRGFKPVVLLPLEARSWSTIVLKTVLLHELSHIKRNDYWLHTLGLITVCLYWYHPLVWIMKKRQLLEREKACDEAVLRAGIPQQNYAEQLVHIARQLSGRSTIISETALPMAKISQTKARILAILQFDQQQFNFSTWKQWNWGLFYACVFPMLAAFTPVGEVMQTHFDLPKLERIDRFLTTNSIADLIISTTIFNASENELYESNLETDNQGIEIDNAEAIRLSNHLKMLEKEYDLLGIAPPIEEIKIPLRPQKSGLYGKWKAGKSEFTIWTYGEFKIIPTPPYIEVMDMSGIVFIEEYIPGLFRDKVNQLTIGKAPVDGRMGEGYKGKLSALITKGTPIKVWSDNTDYEDWMATKGKDLPKYLLKKQKEQAIIGVTAENKEWKKRIEGSKKWLNGFFVPEEHSIKQVKIEDRRLVLDLSKIPYKQLDLPQGNLVTKKMGRTVLPENGNGGTIGNLSTNPKGIKYITVLKGNQTPALIKDFNFHLAENDFKNVKFSLQLYNIVNGKIGYAITKQPIPLTLAADQKGWIKMDLSTFNIVTKGDVLVVLTNNGFSGTKRRTKLYFSFAKKHQDYQPLLVDNSWKTKIWEKAFAMYLGVEQAPDRVGFIDNQENRRLHGKWKQGKSEFTIWIDGEFKIIEEAPYIEVVSDDGMVIIEEYEDRLLGDKVHKLLLTKAPYDGRMRSLNWRKSIFDSPLIEKGTPIKIWDRVLSNGSYDKWMRTKGHQVAQYLASRKQDYLIQIQNSENRVWSQKVERGKRMIDFHFTPEEQIIAKKERIRRRAELQSRKIPYRKLAYPIEEGQSNIIGRTNLSGKDMGNDWLIKDWRPNGTQYMTVLEGNTQPALIKAFNFHLSKNDFVNLSFELQLYNVVDNEIQYAITKSPIPIQIKEGSGWIKKDLSTYGIVTQGNVLVALENTDFSGPKNEKGLYFSLTDDYEVYEAIISSMFKWKNQRILEQAFVMNLEIEQHSDKIGLLEKGASERISQPKVSSVSAETIVKTAINKLTTNYIQKPHSADLYYLYSSLSPSDSLAYQSEAVLKYYDSKGYQKRGWRNAATSRYAKLEEGRVIVGEQKEQMELSELGRFFVFWSHEPIITNDKPLSESSMNAYNYQLVGTKEFMGQQVFEIDFVCTKLKDRFAGLPSLKYMKGKLYINQADYAIVRYEHSHLMDYEFSGKHPKKRGNLKERKIIESSRIEIFSKNKAGYYLDYAKNIEQHESQHTLLNGQKEIRKGKIMEEYQYANIDTKNVEPLTENLLKFNKETIYNSDFWKEFAVNLNENR